MNGTISEGCSACACGIEGACSAVYTPAFTIPGAVILGLTLVALLVLFKKKKIKIKPQIILGTWLIATLLFASLVWVQSETELDRVRAGAEYCRTHPTGYGDIACEY